MLAPPANDPLDHDPLAEPAPTAPVPTTAQRLAVRNAYAAGHEIEGMNILRDAYGLGLAEAKALAESIVADLPPHEETLTDPTPAPRFTVHDGKDAPADAPADAEVTTLYATPPDRKVLSEKDREYTVPLTEEERLRLGARLAVLELEVADEEAANLAAKQAAKKRLDALKGERTKLAQDLRAGSTTMNLLVREEIDYPAGIVRDIDVSTGRVLAQRPLLPSEAQVPMFVGPAPTGKDPHRLEPVEGADSEGDDDGPDDGHEHPDDGE